MKYKKRETWRKTRTSTKKNQKNIHLIKLTTNITEMIIEQVIKIYLIVII